jgi:hypothetical protein
LISQLSSASAKHANRLDIRGRAFVGTISVRDYPVSYDAIPREWHWWNLVENVAAVAHRSPCVQLSGKRC